MSWFEVDRDGLRQLLEDRDKSFILRELVQNAWDEPGVTRCDVALEAIPGKRAARLVVEDDAPEGFYETYFADPEALQRFLDQFDRSKGCVSTEYGMTYWIRDGNDVSEQYYDLNNAMVDAIADMLPALREEARRSAVKDAQEQVRQAEQKLARLQAVSGGAVE